MNKIRLNEIQFKSMIYDCVYNILDKSFILEYAIQRKSFISLVRDLSYQIVENWCLIRYCTITNRTELKEHWKTELKSYFKRLIRLSIKNNDYKTRFKAAKEGFNEADMYQSAELIFSFVKDKFKTENIKFDDILMTVIEDCYNSLDSIVDVIATYNDHEKIENYVNLI
ncbi:MAG: hypothetical protein IKT40_08780 [Bacilli bacterium]|nr:hypothetical protein [Bacilli bacterium]